MILRLALLLVVTVGTAGAGGGYVLAQPRLAAQYAPGITEWLVDAIDGQPPATAPLTFSVRPGETGAEVGERLAAAGAISDPRLFRYLLAYYGAETSLRAGEYRLDPSGGTRSVVQQLLGGGRDKLVAVTVPEGLRAEEVATLLEEHGVASRGEFLALVFSGRSPVPDLPPNAAGSLEGYLYPETYNVPAGFGAEEMLTFMLQTFRERALPTLRRAGQVGLSAGQALVLASIVEREAAIPEERPLLAGVFHNRLRLGMPLAADPTVQYLLVPPGTPQPPAGGYWKRDLTLDDLRATSPYNTYITPGLPPSPIANPGLGAILGVVEPVASEYLYFVARPDGSHALAATFEEHLANVQRYRP